MKKVIIVFLFVIFSKTLLCAQALTKKEERNYRHHPVWITMMNDPHVNYYKAEEAFNLFWEGKEKPEEEGYEGEEIGGEKKEKKSFFEKLFENDKDAKKYAFQYKQFKNWLKVKYAYLKPDGTLMSEDEFQQQVQDELSRRKQVNR